VSNVSLHMPCVKQYLMPHYPSYPQDFHKHLAIHVFCLLPAIGLRYKVRHGRHLARVPTNQLRPTCSALLWGLILAMPRLRPHHPLTSSIQHQSGLLLGMHSHLGVWIARATCSGSHAETCADSGVCSSCSISLGSLFGLTIQLTHVTIRQHTSVQQHTRVYRSLQPLLALSPRHCLRGQGHHPLSRTCSLAQNQKF